MSIVNGIVPGPIFRGPLEFRQARHAGGPIVPEIVILHDTASRLTRGSAAKYLQDNDAKVSVHFVIERDGTIVQQVRTDRRANHAGKSRYHGRENCNGFSIGIEMVNPGRMTRASATEARTWFEQRFDIAEYGIEEVATPEHGSGLWMPYTEDQIGAVVLLLEELFAGIDTLRDITTHWYVSPGRKVDTNPLFPLEHVRALVLGREDPVDDDLDALARDAMADEFVQIDTPGDTLNMRRWPSFNPNVIAAIPHDTIVPVLRRGAFAGQDWLCVFYGGREGWIVAAYADPIVHQEVQA